MTPQDVRVRDELSELTDGRERFAGRSGVISREPAGRLAATDDQTPSGEHFEHAYEVRFEDGDEAIFTADELEGEGLVPFRPLQGALFGTKDASAAADAASVTKT